MALSPSPFLGPVLPNFHVCDRLYGEGLSTSSCIRLANVLPRGPAAIPYTINQLWTPAVSSLPFNIHVGQ